MLGGTLKGRLEFSGQKRKVKGERQKGKGKRLKQLSWLKAES